MDRPNGYTLDRRNGYTTERLNGYTTDRPNGYTTDRPNGYEAEDCLGRRGSETTRVNPGKPSLRKAAWIDAVPKPPASIQAVIVTSYHYYQKCISVEARNKDSNTIDRSERVGG